MAIIVKIESWIGDGKEQLSITETGNETDNLIIDSDGNVPITQIQEESNDSIIIGTDPLNDISQLDNGKVYFQYEE